MVDGGREGPTVEPEVALSTEERKMEVHVAAEVSREQLNFT